MAKRKQGKPIGEAFSYITNAVLKSAAYIALSPRARALLVEFALQYRGNNNGDLTAAPSVLSKRGWRSRSALSAALEELIDAGLICVVRQGRKPRVCTLYGLTWRDYDYNPAKHEISPSGFPRNEFLLMRALRSPPVVIHAEPLDHRRTSGITLMPANGPVRPLVSES